MAEPARIDDHDDSRTAATAVEQELCQQMVDMHLGAVGRGEKVADDPRPAPRCWPALHSSGVQIRIHSATARRVLTEGMTHAGGRRRVMVLILDFSGSMDPYKAMLRKAARDIVESAVTSGTESSLVIIKFATSACAVNEDNEDVAEERIGHSTNYTAGFKVAADELRSRGVAPADATVIFMTDGEPDRERGCISAEDVPALRNCTFVPVLFSPHGKSNATLVARLHGIEDTLSTTSRSREHFVLHTLKTADGTNAADTMLSTLQIARGVLARFVYLRAMGERAPLTLGSDAVDAVAFLPLDEERVAAARAAGFVDATIEMEGAPQLELRLTFQENADEEEQRNPTAGLLLELETLVEQTSRVTASGPSSITTSAAAAAATVAARGDSNTRALLATCRHLREALHNNTDGAVVLLRNAIAEFETAVTANALAPDALRTALSTSAHPALQASLQNLRSLTTNVARAAALANTASGLVVASSSSATAVRGSQLRGAAARLQSLVATTASSSGAERSLQLIYTALSKELKRNPREHLPSYLTEDVLLNDVAEDDAPAIVLTTPGCALGAVVAKATSDAVTPTERDLAAAREALGRAMNHGDASRVAFPFGGVVLTRTSMMRLQESGARLLPSAKAKLVFVAPTQGAMKQQAEVLTGLILLGEPIALSGKYHEALLGVASAMLTQTEELESPIALATLAFAARAFLGAHTPSNDTQHSSTLGAIERRLTFHFTAGPITSLRTAATAHAIGAARFEMHHFVEELVRKRVQQLARHQPARLGAELERLMADTGVWGDERERAQRKLNSLPTLKEARDMLGSKVEVLYPRAVNPSHFVYWLVNLMHDGVDGEARRPPHQHATHWEECPSWDTFALMMRRAYAMNVFGAHLLRDNNSTRGWITDDALQRLRSTLTHAFPQQDDVSLIIDLLGGAQNAARATVHAMYALLQMPKKCPRLLEPFFAGTALLENSCITMPLLRTGVGRERETTPVVAVARLMRGRALEGPGDAELAESIKNAFARLLRETTSAHERIRIAKVLRDRAAVLVTPDSELQALLQELGLWESFQFPERVERGFDPMKPTRKDFHRRLMGVCAKLGMNEPRTYTRAEVRARLMRVTDARHKLASAHWLTFAEDGVTLARNGRHTNAALRIDRVAGVARTSAAPSAPSAAAAAASTTDGAPESAVDSVRALDPSALMLAYRAMF